MRAHRWSCALMYKSDAKKLDVEGHAHPLATSREGLWKENCKRSRIQSKFIIAE